MPEPTVGVAVLGAKELVEISAKLGVIDAVKAKLVSQRDPAASKLLSVLSEISKIYLAFEEELTRFFSLTLEPKEQQDERRILVELEGGKIIARMSAARGHCGRIDNIFHRYLAPWFKRALAPDEVASMENLFRQLSETDNTMLDVIDKVADWLVTETGAINALVQRRQYAQARRRLGESRAAALPARQAIAKAMKRINTLEAEFIKASGAL